MAKEFQTAYAALNTAQKRAVDTIDGPVLVVAGPGTGKTQLLSTRVANILRQTDADPSNILCLTFTNKAAINMRERLNQQIGAESRYVMVRTFHSFSAEIMNNYPDYFWEGARLSVAPDAVQLEIIQSILAGLAHDNPLASTFAGAYTALGDIQNGLRLIKEAGLLPDELRAIIKSNLEYIEAVEPKLADILTPPLSFKSLASLQAKISQLPEQKAQSLLLPLNVVIKDSLEIAIDEDQPTGKTKACGKWKQRWIQTINGQKGMFSERKRNQWWLALAGVYELYREQLPQRGYYDYDDMLIEVLHQLDSKPEMLADLQERYQYVLIDEFQDTNAAQLRLANLIADHYASNGKPNLMAVGDDDQSIFAFNGAELNNMLEFRRRYPATKLIVLEENYRSTQAILDSAKTIIDQAEDRLVKREKQITKNLQTADPNLKLKSTIEHTSWPTRQHQQAGLAARIKGLWHGGEASIAVLARTHDSLKQLAAILLKQGIPVNYERQSNILEHQAVRQFCLIADVAVAIAEGNQNVINVEVAELLQHEMWQIKPKTLWELAKANFSSPDWLNSLLDNGDPKLKAIGEWLVWLSRQSRENSLTFLINHILGLEESSYLLSPLRHYYLDLHQLNSDYLETLSAVEILRNLAQEFASKTEASLADFMRFVKLNLSTERVIADESWFTSGERAVNLLTVYKAKGLEFDNVFIVDAIESSWQPRINRRPSPANLRLESYGEKYDDYVRLLYVAISRAKRNFMAASYYTDERGTQVLPTPLLDSLPITTIKEPTEEPVEVIESNLRWPRLSTSDEKALLKTRLEEYSLSQSSLIDFLNVAEAGPASFLERNLLRVPHARDARGAYGSAVHAALETAQRLVNTGKFDLRPVLDRFEAELHDEHLAPIDYERYHGRGLALLESLFKDQKLALIKGGLTEQRLKDIGLGQARINGSLDRVDVNNDEIMISDYKTGAPLKSFDTTDQNKAVKAWRHRTQLLFYALLLKESRRFPASRHLRAQMIYLESEASNMSLILTPQPEELERLQQLIEAVWQHIIKLSFPDVSKYSANRQGISDFEDDLLSHKI